MMWKGFTGGLRIINGWRQNDQAMKKIIILIIAVQCLNSMSVVAQEKGFASLAIDTPLLNDFFFDSRFIVTPFYFDVAPGLLDKNPDAEDSMMIEKYGHLINGLPDSSNYEKYASLPGALFELNRLAEAEKMLRAIIQSKEPFYRNTVYHSSGTAYGYGSFTSNYKHNACLTLARVLMEKKQFKEALGYVREADKKYVTYYTCGTGAHSQRRQFKGYYSRCYEGAGMINDGIRFLLPYALDGEYEGLAYFLKKKYSVQQIKNYLALAYKNIRFTRNKDSTYSGTIDEENKFHRTEAYISGQGSTILFGAKVNFPSISLKDKEVITLKHFQDAFKESRLYKELVEKK
jgi:hypothetical protein